LNSFIDDNNNKSNENYLSIFNCFLSTAAILVFICVKLTFISRLRKVVNRQPLVIQYSRHNNVYWTSNLLQRKEMWRVARQFIHTCLFKTLLTETNHEWHEARIIISSFDWWSVWTIHTQMSDGNANVIFRLFFGQKEKILSIQKMYF
jgi:hypothetical protein